MLNSHQINALVKERMYQLSQFRLQALHETTLEALLETCNPYLLRATHKQSPSQLITTLLDQRINEIEETFTDSLSVELNHVVGTASRAQAQVMDRIEHENRRQYAAFRQEREKRIRQLVEVFSHEFCDASGKIDWKKIVQFNSGNSQ